MDDRIPLSPRSWRYVRALTGQDAPTAAQVARAWSPCQHSQPGCSMPMEAEIEDWIAARHEGFRLARELSVRARNVLRAALGGCDHHPSDLSGLDVDDLTKVPSCGRITLDEIQAWMRGHGVSFRSPGPVGWAPAAVRAQTLPPEVDAGLSILVGQGDSAGLRAVLGAAWAAMPVTARREFLSSEAVRRMAPAPGPTG